MSNDGPKRRLPVTWKSGENVIHDTASIVMPTDAQVASFADQKVHVCGECRHFRGTQKDRPAISRFVATAVMEAKWKLGYLTHKPEELGRCGENADLAVGVTSRACDHFTPGNGRLT